MVNYDETEQEKFFYTTNTPYQWSSGPVIVYSDDKGKAIVSLEQAKVLALQHHSGVPGTKDYVAVSWGTVTELNLVRQAKS